MTSRPQIETPSFEPYVGRVRTARAVGAVGAFVITGSLSYGNGMPLEDAALRAMVVAVMAYFMAWGAALWCCSELYHAQIDRLRRRLEEAEQRKADQLQELYMQRLADGEAREDKLDSTSPMQPPAARRSAA